MEALLKVTDAVRSIKVRPYFAKQEGALSNQEHYRKQGCLACDQ